MLRIMPYERKTYDPMDMFRDFEKSFFGVPAQFNSMRTDIKDEGDKYVLESELPGFEKEDIKLDIESNYLILSAEHSTQNDTKDEKDNYIRRERSYGSYKRSFDISDVITEKIDAEYKNGILIVTLPKKSADVPQVKNISIR